MARKITKVGQYIEKTEGVWTLQQKERMSDDCSLTTDESLEIGYNSEDAQ